MRFEEKIELLSIEIYETCKVKCIEVYAGHISKDKIGRFSFKPEANSTYGYDAMKKITKKLKELNNAKI